MKKLFTILSIFALTFSAFAQTKMIINKTDGTADSLLLSQIESISFKTLSQNGMPTVTTLITGLEGANSLWIHNDYIYLTETAGRNTSFGGKISLDRYDIQTGQNQQLTNNPENSEAVVVSTVGKIYLTSYYNSIPGDYGKFSEVDPSNGVETHLLDLQIASADMYIDNKDDILIIGSSDNPQARSLYSISSINYMDTTVIKTGLGRVWCVSKHNGYIYYSDHSSINRIDSSGNVTTFLNKSVMSITFSSTYLYYADFFNGKIGRVNLNTKADETIISNLNAPHCLRFDANTNRLYFVEFGTSANQYKDGTLEVATW